ncbi:MAG: sulfurtransferase TusA family protein [Clostridiaceae bacterium]|nr:sulfurtransferase TusA family protein [Clostridia bacterium]MDD7311010.1 sulfurtransferase TusA family protein [Clostridia bacterium]MDY3870831.1 sulfurtransferase TusA family protein [Clostridiaceae bacterium]
MAKITVDARGLSCPQPVVLTMEALKQNAEAYEILVDNQTALNNVSRFVKNAGKTASVTEKDDEYIIEVK